MNKIKSLSELSTLLGKKANVKAWEKGGKKRLYFKGYGYNTKKMSTDAYIDLSVDRAVAVVRIDCPSQPSSWISSQEQEVREQLASRVRYCNIFFDFGTTGQPAEVVMNNAILAAEPVHGYYTEWREVTVSINRFNKKAVRNRQFVVPFEGTKDSAPRGFVPLSEKGYAFLKARGEEMLEPYTPVPNYDDRVALYEQIAADQREAQQQASEKAVADQAQKEQQAQQSMAMMAQLQKEGTPLLQAWKASGCPHPAPAEVCEAKKASGLTWGGFAESI